MNGRARCRQEKATCLILGIGNILMGDEGVGVHVARRILQMPLPAGVECVDGGTGGLTLLGTLQECQRAILIDATADGAPAGSVRRLRPRYASDYPRTLTAHDIGLKDLLDVMYLLGEVPDITLYAVSIALPREPTVELTEHVAASVPQVATQVLQEVSG